MTANRPSVAIVHPWLPHYRVAFFERLKVELDTRGVDLHLAYGTNPPFATDRGDEASVPWGHTLHERKLRIAGRTLVSREQWQPALRAHLLILEDGLRNLDTYVYLARRSRRGLPTAFWGPGQTLDRTTGRLEKWLKRALLKRGDWWFSYTRGTAAHLAARGIDQGRITTVGNTLDTEALRQAREEITEQDVAQTRARLGLTEGHTALFIGGLAEVKNIDLLLEAGRLIAADDPAFRVVFVGDGPKRELVERAQSELGFVLYCGPLFDPREKALIATACDLIAAPGLVGLVAVDSLVLGRPVVTVSPWTHSPEIEYLDHGRNALLAKPTPEDYAAALRELLGDSALRTRLADQCLADAAEHSLDGMVTRFADGVMSAINVS